MDLLFEMELLFAKGKYLSGIVIGNYKRLHKLQFPAVDEQDDVK